MPPAHVFLDIDGVLNSTAWWGRRRTMEFPYREFDPDCLRLLHHLCETATADIVISSSWRSGRDLTSLQALFDDVERYWDVGTSLAGRIVGATAILERERGAEVQAFCAGNEVTRHVILDDQTDFEADQPLVWIDPTHGLRGDDVTRALDWLSE